MSDSETELAVLATRWIEFQRAFLRSKDSALAKELELASDEVLHMPFDAPERTWEFIQLVVQRCEEEDVLGSLAAGPIEDLMSQHGEHFIDRIEIFARDNPKFRLLLRDVWRGTMSDSVWARLQAVQAARGYS